jgi:hypothetical protein
MIVSDIPFHCLVEIFGIYLFYICSIFITYNTALNSNHIHLTWSCWGKELVYRGLNARTVGGDDCRKAI